MQVVQPVVEEYPVSHVEHVLAVEPVAQVVQTVPLLQALQWMLMTVQALHVPPVPEK